MARATEEHGDHPLFVLERGEISETEFGARLERHLGARLRPEPPARRCSSRAGAEHADDRARARAPRRAASATALLTNNVREWEPLWRAKLPEVDELFELIVDSAFVGLRKPDPAIYTLTLERLGGVAPERCVFVDDLDVNCDTARELGMTAVRFESAEPGDPGDPNGLFCVISGIAPDACLTRRERSCSTPPQRRGPERQERSQEDVRLAAQPRRPRSPVARSSSAQFASRFFCRAPHTAPSCGRSARRASASRRAAARARRSAGAARAPSRRPPPRGRRAPGSSPATRTSVRARARPGRRGRAARARPARLRRCATRCAALSTEIGTRTLNGKPSGATSDSTASGYFAPSSSMRASHTARPALGRRGGPRPPAPRRDPSGPPPCGRRRAPARAWRRRRGHT